MEASAITLAAEGGNPFPEGPASVVCVGSFFMAGASCLGRFSTGTAVAGCNPRGRPAAAIRFGLSLRCVKARLARLTVGDLTEVHIVRRVASWGNGFPSEQQAFGRWAFRKLLNLL